jgi:sugar phosphate isomerase/epimerase
VPGLGLIFDSANLVQLGIRPMEAWRRMRDHVVYLHIKDAVFPTGEIVPPGEGDGDIPEILADAITARGYEGFVSLEPHLAAAGEFSGFSGPEPFKKAVRLVKGMLDGLGAAYDAKP